MNVHQHRISGLKLTCPGTPNQSGTPKASMDKQALTALTLTNSGCRSAFGLTTLGWGRMQSARLQQRLNGIYEKYFSQPFPTRTTIAAAALPLGACVEIDLVVKA